MTNFIIVTLFCLLGPGADSGSKVGGSDFSNIW